MNEKLAKIKKNVKRYAPAVIAVTSVATTVAVLAHRHLSETDYLELTPEEAAHMKEHNANLIFETKNGDFKLTYIPEN